MASEKTRSDLVTRALQILGAVATGQNPAAEDTQLVDDQVDSIVEEMASKGIYSFDPDAIPLEAFQALAVVLADAVAADFGQSGGQRAPDAGGSNPYDRAIASLRLITAQRPTGSVLAVDYF
jgi:hypothetical protein